MTAVTDSVSRFFQWWFRELAACAPLALRRAFWREPTLLALVAGEHEVQVVLNDRGRARELGLVSLDRKAEPQRRLAQLLRGIASRDIDVAVLMPADAVLRRNVSLPLAAAENLREVLAFEMDRHTPFKAAEVAFDYRIAGTDVAAKVINVDLAVMPRAAMERARTIASLCGVTTDRIGITGDARRGSPAFNFLPSPQRAGRSAFSRRLGAAVAILAVILGLVAVYLPHVAKTRTLAASEERLAASRVAALEADTLRKRLEERLEHDRFLIDRRLKTTPATVLLAEITDRLPDDTWLIQMRWQGDKLAMVGYSPAAAALIAGLEQSDLLSEVHFGSPVTADARVERERFNITAVVTAPKGE